MDTKYYYLVDFSRWPNRSDYSKIVYLPEILDSLCEFKGLRGRGKVIII